MLAAGFAFLSFSGIFIIGLPLKLWRALTFFGGAKKVSKKMRLREQGLRHACSLRTLRPPLGDGNYLLQTLFLSGIPPGNAHASGEFAMLIVVHRHH